MLTRAFLLQALLVPLLLASGKQISFLASTINDDVNSVDVERLLNEPEYTHNADGDKTCEENFKDMGLEILPPRFYGSQTVYYTVEVDFKSSAGCDDNYKTEMADIAKKAFDEVLDTRAIAEMMFNLGEFRNITAIGGETNKDFYEICNDEGARVKSRGAGTLRLCYDDLPDLTEVLSNGLNKLQDENRGVFEELESHIAEVQRRQAAEISFHHGDMRLLDLKENLEVTKVEALRSKAIIDHGFQGRVLKLQQFDDMEALGLYPEDSVLSHLIQDHQDQRKEHDEELTRLNDDLNTVIEGLQKDFITEREDLVKLFDILVTETHPVVIASLELERVALIEAQTAAERDVAYGEVVGNDANFVLGGLAALLEKDLLVRLNDQETENCWSSEGPKVEIVFERVDTEEDMLKYASRCL